MNQIDDRTPNLSLPLPNIQNSLEFDGSRIKESFTILDKEYKGYQNSLNKLSQNIADIKDSVNLLQTTIENLQEELSLHKNDPNTHGNLIVPSTNLRTPRIIGSNTLFYGKEYWTEDRVNAWLAKSPKVGHYPIYHRVINDMNEYHYAISDFTLWSPLLNIDLIIPPTGAELSEYSISANYPYINIEGYDFSFDLNYTPTAPITLLPGTNYWRLSSQNASIRGVVIEMGEIFVQNNSYVYLQNVILRPKIYGYSLFRVFETSSATIWNSVFEVGNLGPTNLWIIDDNSYMGVGNSKILGIDKIPDCLIYVNSGQLELEGAVTFEGTPSETLRPYVTGVNGGIRTNGNVIPGSLPGHIGPGCGVI